MPANERVPIKWVLPPMRSHTELALGYHTWSYAIIIGSLLNFMFFLALPSLGKLEPHTEPPVYKVSFMPWQPPQPKTERVPQAEPTPEKNNPPPKPKPKPKPKAAPKAESPIKTVPKPVLTSSPETVETAAAVAPLEQAQSAAKTRGATQTSEEEAVDSLEALPMPVAIFELTTLPRFIHQERPIYPPGMRSIGKEGTVKLDVLIDNQGKVRQVTVLKSAGAVFDEAAIQAMWLSSFSAGNINGKPVAVMMRMPVRFRLR